MTAAVMVGWFDDVFAASNEMVHVSRTVAPNPDNNKVYQDKYQLYKTCYRKCSLRGKAAVTTSRIE